MLPYLATGIAIILVVIIYNFINSVLNFTKLIDFLEVDPIELKQKSVNLSKEETWKDTVNLIVERYEHHLNLFWWKVKKQINSLPNSADKDNLLAIMNNITLDIHHQLKLAGNSELELIRYDGHCLDRVTIQTRFSNEILNLARQLMWARELIINI